MPGIAAILAWILSNPAVIAGGEAAIAAAIGFVNNAIALNKAGVLSDAQLAQVWAQMGVNVESADAAWDAAKAAHNQAKGA